MGKRQGSQRGSSNKSLQRGFLGKTHAAKTYNPQQQVTEKSSSAHWAKLFAPKPVNVAGNTPAEELALQVAVLANLFRRP